MTEDTPCPVPDAPDDVKQSQSSSPSASSDEPIVLLLSKLGEALMVLIHTQAEQAGRLALLSVELSNLAESIRQLIAFGTDAAGEDDDQPDIGTLS